MESSYTGLTLPAEVTAEWAAALLEEFKAGRKLHRKYLLQILKRIRALFERLPTLLDITFPGFVPPPGALRKPVLAYSGL